MKIKEELIKEFEEKFVTDGITYNMEDGTLNRDRNKIRIKDPEKAITFLSQAIDKAYEAGGEDMLNKLRKDGSTKLKMKLLGLKHE